MIEPKLGASYSDKSPQGAEVNKQKTKVKSWNVLCRSSSIDVFQPQLNAECWHIYTEHFDASKWKFKSMLFSLTQNDGALNSNINGMRSKSNFCNVCSVIEWNWISTNRRGGCGLTFNMSLPVCYAHANASCLMQSNVAALHTITNVCLGMAAIDLNLMRSYSNASGQFWIRHQNGNVSAAMDLAIDMPLFGKRHSMKINLFKRIVVAGNSIRKNCGPASWAEWPCILHGSHNVIVYRKHPFKLVSFVSIVSRPQLAAFCRLDCCQMLYVERGRER